jgi:hypothetical protein
MTTFQTLYMIQCTSHGQITYFSRGIHIYAIPFEKYNSIKLFRYTLMGKKVFVFDLMFAFCQIQRFWKARIRAARSPASVLRREGTGLMHLPQLSLPNRPRLGSLSPSPFA